MNVYSSRTNDSASCSRPSDTLKRPLRLTLILLSSFAILTATAGCGAKNNAGASNPGSSAGASPVIEDENWTATASLSPSPSPSPSPISEQTPVPSGLDSRKQEQGKVTFQEKEGAAIVELPLIGVKVNYNVDSGEGPPSVLPKEKLPVQAFAIPEALAPKLAVYWMNLGYQDQGFMVLAPKDWQVDGADVGANGSFGISLSDPADPKSTFVTTDTAGGCQGCAISDIGAYFPKLSKWADDRGFPAAAPMTYASSKEIGKHIISYALKPKETGYVEKGAAYEEHDKDALFRRAQVSISKANQSLADTMVSYYIWMYKDN